MATERHREESEGRGEVFHLFLPGGERKYKERPIEEKTALWVPFEEIKKCGFRSSEICPDVLISDDIISILRTISRQSKISPRSELENDPEKQQVIFYTAIICKDPQGEDKLLWYQRSTPEAANLPEELLGDERLRGKYSIGFGGHKTKDDILSVEKDLLEIMLPGFSDELTIMVGVNRGMLNEVMEETGLGLTNFEKPPKVLGAFMDRRKTSQGNETKTPVGFVHLALPTIIEISPEKTDCLRFCKREVIWAEWFPLKESEAKLEEFTSSPYDVDSWTEVFVKEFLLKR